MKLFITPAEVAAMAFGGEGRGIEAHMDDAVIASAQRKFLKPVLGELYVALEAGRYGALLSDYVKPALAQWVRYLVLPSLSAQAGAAGVVQYGGSGFDAAGDKSLARLLRRTRGNAGTLTLDMVEHIEANGDDYPEYRAQDNVLNRIGISGGLVL